MHLYVHIYECVCIYVCVYVYMYVYIYIYIYINLPVYRSKECHPWWALEWVIPHVCCDGRLKGAEEALGGTSCHLVGIDDHKLA